MRASPFWRWYALPSAALLGAILAVAPAPAYAFEIFGIKIFGGKDDEADDTIGDPYRYQMDFQTGETPDGEKLDKLLKGASTLWKDREKAASGAAGLIAKARGDYRRLLATLYSEGRYGGTISITIDGREAADLAPDAEISNPANVVLSVDPGPLFHFREAEVTNQAPPTDDRRDRVERPQDNGFVPGEVAKSGTIVQAGKLSVEAWRQQGYPKAAVSSQDVVAAHDQDVIDARVNIDPGRQATFGDVSVEGTERMDPAFVEYMTGIKFGAEYDPDDLEKANKRLARLEVFRSLRLQEADKIKDDGSLPVAVIVQERPLRRFGVGASYSTLDGAGFDAYWMHRNLFGHAERLRFDAKVAGIGQTIDPKEFNYRVGVSFTRPGVYTPDTDFVSSLIGDREVLDAYTRTSVTASAGFTHLFTDELSGRIMLNGGYGKFEDDVYGKREFESVGFLGGLRFDNRDNQPNPTEGFYLDVEAEPFYEFNYGNAALRMVAEGRAYYALDSDDRFIVAGRLKIGSVVGPDSSEIAPDKLFFAGGGGSVRGYAYRNIGVETPNGIVGGKSLIEGSAELRARVTDSIGLVGFVDAGYVGADSWPGFSEDLKVGAGVGLRYLTGLGPIRLDLAVPLDRGPDDPDVAFYVGIGQAF